MADITVTAANVLLLNSGRTDTGTAGATITAGQALYVDASDSNKLKLAQSDGTAAEAVAVGVSLHAALAGQPIRYAVDGSIINIGGTTAKNTAYVVSTTAGGVAPSTDLTSGHRIVWLGYATGTTGAMVLTIRDHGVTV
jgi:hypothetical protein